MGTNFYIKDKYIGKRIKDSHKHIGKRSAAGWYCWDCKITLCKNGESGVHFCVSEWYEVCPICHKVKPEKNSLLVGAVARELGFDKSEFAPRTGVDSCSSFSWAIDPEGEEYQKLLKKRGKPIIDEYKTTYRIKTWLKMLEECPLRFTDSIGSDFS